MVFSAYGNWTYDAEDVGLPDYCAKPPFLFAFAVLITNWVESYCIFFFPLNPYFLGGRTCLLCCAVLCCCHMLGGMGKA